MKTAQKKDKKENKRIQPRTFCELVSELSNVNAGEKSRIDFSKLESKRVVKEVSDLFGIKSKEIGEKQADFFIEEENQKNFLKSIERYCSKGHAIIDDWEEVGDRAYDEVISNNLYRGVDFLYDLESKRVYKNKDEYPLSSRSIVLVIIKVKTKSSKRNKYLFIYSNKTTKYQMIGGYKKEGESSSNAAIRHLEKDIKGFKFDKSIHKLKAIFKNIKSRKISKRWGIYTHYDLDIFQLEGLEQIPTLNESFRFFTINEMLRGVSDDGQSIFWTIEESDNGYEKLRNLNLSCNMIYEEKAIVNKPLLYTKRVRKQLQQLLIEDESITLEFKSSIRWDCNSKKINKDLEKIVIKTIVAFMNSEGGTLILGIRDDKTIFGLRKDISTLRIKNIDGLIQYLMGLIPSYIGNEFARLIKVSPVEVDGKTVCLVTVYRADEPVFYNENEVSSFYVRAGNTTRQLNSRETYKYILKNWE